MKQEACLLQSASNRALASNRPTISYPRSDPAIHPVTASCVLLAFALRWVTARMYPHPVVYIASIGHDQRYVSVLNEFHDGLQGNISFTHPLVQFFIDGWNHLNVFLGK
jgi:hypothetical protein